MLLSLFLFLLHLQNLILQLLVFKHQKLILSVKLRNSIESAIDFYAKCFCSFIDAFGVSRRLLRARLGPTVLSTIVVAVTSLLCRLLVATDTPIQVHVTIQAAELGFANIGHCSSEKLGKVLRNVFHGFKVTHLILEVKDLVKLDLRHFSDLGSHVQVCCLVLTLG